MGEQKDKMEQGSELLSKEENLEQNPDAIKTKDAVNEEHKNGFIAKVGNSLLSFMQRIPGINRLPLHRLGPGRTVLGVLLLLLVFGGTVALMVSGIGDTFAGEKEDPKLILTFQEKKWEIDLQELGYDGKEISTVNQEQLIQKLEKIKKEIDQPKVDAKMEKVGEPIQPAQQGQKMDLEKIKQEWIPDLASLINKPQKLPVSIEKPQVTEEDLKRVEEKLIGSYVTYYNPGNVNRTTNLRLASEAIHNKVINPGELFSFNETVGQRTIDRGYKPATVIVSGEFSEGVGGGICQISSTLYNSVDKAGLKIVARQPHSKRVDYVPLGRDAAVAWGVIDFKFENSLEKPIVIKTNMNNGKLTIEVYTTPEVDVEVQKAIPAAPKQSEQKSIQVDPHQQVTPGSSTPPVNTTPPATPSEPGGSDSDGTDGSEDGSPNDEVDG